MNNTKVLAFGEVLWDFIEGDKHFGGAPVNFAAHMVQCGREAAIVTAVGADKLGDQAIEAMTHLNVGQDFVQRNDKLTGRVMVFLEEGQPSYRIRKDVAYDYIERSAIDPGRLQDYGAFYFGTLAQRHSVSRSALDHIMTNGRFSTVFYDVNLRRDSYSAETVGASFGYCTIAKMNDEEVQVLSKLLCGEESDEEGFASYLLQTFSNIELLIITGGGEGCTIRTRTKHYKVSAQMMPVKDSVGAGDAFCAAFLNTYLTTRDPRKSARIGNIVGGFVVSEHGAIPIYPEQFRRKIEILSAG